MPNKEYHIGIERLITEIQQLSTDGLAPTPEMMNKEGAFSEIVYKDRFNSWFQAVVRSGTNPRRPNPLTEHQYQEFFNATLDRQKPREKLIGLLFMFTGLPPRLVEDLPPDWITERSDTIFVSVPPERTISGKLWQFDLLQQFAGQDTGLPSLLAWYHNQHGPLDIGPLGCRDIVYRIAQDATLPGRRQTTDRQGAPAPEVHPIDLRATLGIMMARNRVPEERICQHCGLEFTDVNMQVEDFFTWCEVHDDDFKHPDWDPDWT